MLFVCKARSPHRMVVNCSAWRLTAVHRKQFRALFKGLNVKWVELTECQHPVDDFYTFPEDFQFNLS